MYVPLSNRLEGKWIENMDGKYGLNGKRESKYGLDGGKVCKCKT